GGAVALDRGARSRREARLVSSVWRPRVLARRSLERRSRDRRPHRTGRHPPAGARHRDDPIERAAGARACGGRDLYFLISSTRRFLARPSSVWLLATGFVSPNPAVVSRASSIPNVCMRYVFTAAARSRDSLRFAAAAPTLSVCPTISSMSVGSFLSTSPIGARAATDSVLIVALPVSNRML